MRSRRIVVALMGSAALVAAGISASTASSPPSGQRRPVVVHIAAEVRVDQLGYLPDEAKRARLMVAHRISGERFRVVDRHGMVVFRGRVPADPVGRWNDNYRVVYRLRFDGLTEPGRYHLVTRGPVVVSSPPFGIVSATRLYGRILHDGVKFDQVQRDGLHVIPGALNRKPAHRHDRRAFVYAKPHFVPGSDLITDRDLHRIGGPVDVSGGWYDAGDYLKFAHSTAYNDVLLFTSAQLVRGRLQELLIAEARHGIQWLDKMWRPRDGVLYMQVGVGSGNRAGTFRGDHDGWRLPQADDHNTRHIDRYVSHRPVFRAAPPHKRISPNLVGRVSAAFALAAVADARDHPRRARHELTKAKLLFARAATRHPPKQLVTALPHAFYPEDSWQDDMELGAAEIALASRRLGEQARPYVVASGHWARAYIRSRYGDTLNLYDTSALAHAALVNALSRTGMSGLAVSRADLMRDIQHQLETGVSRSRRDPFASGVIYDNFDANSHAFALVATAAIYHRLSGPHHSSYDRFATSWRNWLLGENPWGVAAMVGIGQTFPHCMQHQIANLEGSTDGSRPLDVGAVVNGPNDARIFAGGLGGYQDGMVHCPGTADPFKPFNGRGSRYVDDVRSWQTDEPALDMTGAAIIAAAEQLAAHRASR